MTIFLLLLDSTKKDTALAFNGPPYDGAHLSRSVLVEPIPITAVAPYPYAGKFVLPTGLLTNPDFAVMWNFLATLSTVEIDPAQAWPSSGGGDG